MARKQKANIFDKFLDLIGIVDTNEDDPQGNGYEDDFNTGRNSGKGSAKNTRFTDEFDNEPRMSRAGNRRPGASSADHSKNTADSGFDADEGWADHSARPEYGARNQQRAQSKARPASSRYGNEQRSGTGTSSRASSRYDGADNGGYYKENGSYQDYQQNSYRNSNSSYGSSYGSYGSNSRRYENETSYAYAAPEQKEAANANQQRHQTVIFKLHSVDECKGVIMALIEKKSVLLNLDDLDTLQAQRTLDTMSGATFAIGARLSRASDRTWLITPSTVEVNDKQNDNAASAGPGSGYGGRYY